MSIPPGLTDTYDVLKLGKAKDAFSSAAGLTDTYDVLKCLQSTAVLSPMKFNRYI